MSSSPQVDTNSKKRRALHVAVATYEFTYSPFSGNGILARSLVKSLLQHHGCRVTVWCCRPHQHDHNEEGDDDDVDQKQSNKNSNNHLEPPEITVEERSRLQVYSGQPLAAEMGWRRLDDEAAWQDFIWNNLIFVDDDNNQQQQQQHQQEQLEEVLQSVDVRCAIDWTGAHAWRSVPENVLCKGGGGEDATTTTSNNRAQQPPPPLIYLNFRVYSSGVPDKSKHEWYDNMERMALKEADSIVALSQKDVASLQAILRMEKNNDIDTNKDNNTDDAINEREIHVLLPPLRGDMELLARNSCRRGNLDRHLPQAAVDAIAECNNNNNHQDRRRVFVTCVVRLSPEKEAMRFVDFIRANQDLFEQENDGGGGGGGGGGRGYVALLAGARADAKYAARVEKELKEITKCNPSCQVVLLLLDDDSFLSPHNLGAIFARTALNFHPCSYDAYGMTIIEAAAFGVPSVIAEGSSVGASAIVGGSNDASVPVDFSTTDFYGIVRQMLLNNNRQGTMLLHTIGAVARERALSWDEAAYGAKLLEYMQSMIEL